ncbi:hypothetical protein [Alteribacillus sp. YIM 98480]|uniref:hypothetical protein n=1 Tax=Alteribacillus sp. YIM 98480 TaxID=2606599 RepID=UPI00131AE70E|nr:hypothetical protein [Alteribacillus sp. YIM 98480]
MELKAKLFTRCQKFFRVTTVINNQFTDSPNTTQIASGAGKSSAAGSNAALNSLNTEQQQSAGAQGKAKNIGMKGKQTKSSKRKNAERIKMKLY